MPSDTNPEIEADLNKGVSPMRYNKPHSAAGYCLKKDWLLSVKQIKEKGCINARKQYNGKTHCSWFVKYSQHPYWVEKQRLREKRKRGKGAG
jgi:hypothetical protein